jgi:hypothetical protein
MQATPPMLNTCTGMRGSTPSARAWPGLALPALHHNGEVGAPAAVQHLCCASVSMHLPRKWLRSWEGLQLLAAQGGQHASTRACTACVDRAYRVHAKWSGNEQRHTVGLVQNLLAPFTSTQQQRGPSRARVEQLCVAQHQSHARSEPLSRG